MVELKQALMRQFDFSEADWEITKDYFSPEIVEAKEYFLKEGEIASKLGFVKTGLLRSYYWDDGGRDVTLQFFQKGMVVVSPDSFNNQTAAKECISAYEKSELITITREKFISLSKKVPLWQQIGREVSDLKNERLLNRIVQFQTLAAQERYNAFCKEFPGIILKVPLGHIASYLGMDVATLSRLRNKK